ncbi:MAG TPA: LysR family transcriptional regulator [Bordetella sp.]|uniref:LysR family transcriptional regulator n=1 Tax=Bordetella sp. TaxID=28081 RepID=UPI002ED14E6E
MNLSTRQLRAFVALAQERHFTRAAQRCHLTQPAFSALIRSLEETAGARLFDRNTRHVELTVEGRVFEASAQRLLGELELALEDVRDHALRRRGRVAVAALPSLAAGWLPDLLARFHADYPGIVLQLRDALLDPCLDMVQRGEVDFAVAARRDDMTGLESVFLHADRYYLVCRKDHALARREKVRVRDLAREPVIHLARGSSVRKQLDDAIGADALTPLLEVEHLATAAGLISAGLGISIVPAMTLFHFQQAGLTIKPLQDKGLRRSLYLVRRKGRSLSMAAQAFYELLSASRLDLGP